MREIALWENPCRGMDLIETAAGKGGGRKRNRHFFFDIIQELKCCPSDNLVIWGTYENARCLKNILKNDYSIHASACIVNKQYMSMPVNQAVYDADFPFVSLEEWLDTHDQTDIIVDFSYYSDELLDKFRDKTDRVFAGDMMGAFIFGRSYIITQKELSDHLTSFCECLDMWEDPVSKKEYTEFIQQKIFGYYNKEYHKVQYFDTDVIKLNDREIYLDGGAFNGDTIMKFMERVRGYEKIIAVEMDASNFQVLTKMCKNMENIEFIQAGLGEKHMRQKADTGHHSASYVSGNGTCEIEINSIDHLIHGPVTFIKMDIEGYEKDALKGAEKTIRKWRPKLAVCLYHKLEDLWEIPNLVKSWKLGYRLYFRNYHNSASECVMYAVPD